jgi:hypothetical protein
VEPPEAIVQAEDEDTVFIPVPPQPAEPPAPAAAEDSSLSLSPEAVRARMSRLQLAMERARTSRGAVDPTRVASDRE